MQNCPRKVHSLRDETARSEQTEGSYISSSQPAGITSPGIPGPFVPTTKAMMSSGTICSLLLLGMLWMDMAMAGSSFLSPEHQKTQQRKESKKPPAKLQPRALEGWLHPDGRGQAEGTEDELEIRVNRQNTNYLNRTKQMDPEPRKKGLFQFNAPFDVGIKLSGAQYQQHGRALGKFLQDILWEEVKEEAADK